MLRYVDVAHDAARLACEERLAKALARDALHRAIAEAAAVDEARSAAQPQQRRRPLRAPRASLARRRLASLHR